MTYSSRRQNDILIVDDTPENLTVLRQILTEQGYRVRPVLNGELALKTVQKVLPDLILLDIMMPPGMNGYEVCQRLKANDRTCDIPVLFISALDDIMDKVKAFDVGGLDYITKPFQEEEVLARVRTHLNLRNMQTRLQEQNRQLQREISEHRQAEQEIQNLARFPGENPNPVLRIAKDGTVLYANEASLCLVKTLRCHVGQRIPDYLGQMVSESFSSGIKTDVEMTCNDRIFSFTIAPVKHTGYANLYGLDVTERKQAERILRRLEKAVETTEVGITITNEHEKIEYTNPADARMHGYTVNELIGQRSNIFTPPELRESETIIQKDFEDFPNWKRERTNVRKDGTMFPAELVSNPIYDEKDVLIGFVTICENITERKRAEEILHQQRELAESLREVATVLNSSLDLNTVLPRILEQMQRVIPHDSAGIFLQEGDNLVLIASYIGNTSDNRNLGKPIPLHSNNPTVRVFRQKHVLIFDDIRTEPGWMNWPGTEDIRGWMAAPLFAGQEVIGVLTSDHYTPGAYTEEEGQLLQTFANQAAIAIQNAKLFNALEQAKEKAVEAKKVAEAANQAKSVFLANMSHELRTPLNAILGFTQIMARSPHTPEEQENLDIIQHSGEHLLTLINDVLDFSKIEAGRTTLNETNFDLHHLLDDVVDLFRLKAGKKNLQLFFERTEDVPQYVRTDDVKLRQVLMNLLSNAIKFTAEGGVSVRVKGLHPPTPLKGGISSDDDRKFPLEGGRGVFLSLQFEIEDTGPGIAPDEMDKLFETFTQTETGRRTQEGTGLGLPISKKFVQLMGGEIQANSEVDKGTTFTFDIHIGLVDQSTIANQQSSIVKRVIALEPGQPRYRILIADDKPDNRKVLVNFLSNVSSLRSGPSTDPSTESIPSEAERLRTGFELREASNGQEAFDIWKQWRPHVIWIDLRMPVMDGYEATKRIRDVEEQKLDTGYSILDTSIEHPASSIQYPVSSDQYPATSIQYRTVIIAVSASSFEEEQDVALSKGCDDFLRKPFREADVFSLMHKHLGVRFVYEESSKVASSKVAGSRPQVTDQKMLTPEAFAALPDELRTGLQHAVERIDLITTKSLIEQIRQHNPRLADTLTELVKNYRFDTLQELFNNTA
jgi:two-component system sensor histidine kinase/response regulator